ncbi:MAG: cytochrome c3 family protein [bacterium]
MKRFSKGILVLYLTAVVVLLVSMVLAIQDRSKDFIFSHELHLVDVGADCTTCHARAEESQKSGDNNLPTKESCLECHDGDIAPDDCQVCHKDPENPVAFENPLRRIIFSHKNHVARKIECVDCHQGLGETDFASPANLPKMADCQTCHNGTKAEDECTLCHPQPVPKPVSHDLSWIKNHKEYAREDMASCAGCHDRENDCQRCHQGDNLAQITHPLNYLYTHFLDIKGKERECDVCHDQQSFCDDCHQGRGIMPLSHSSLDWANRTLGDGGKHTDAAVRDIEYCASCHDTEGTDPSCLRCHVDFDGRRGNDANPHGPGFGGRMGEGPWHDDDGYLCFDCHTNTHRAGDRFCGYCHGEEDED